MTSSIGKVATIFVDTNILIYAVNSSAPQHEAARAFMLDLIAGKRRWALSWRILYEFLRVMTHPRAERPLPISAALRIVGEFLNSPSLVILVPTERHYELLQRTCTELDAPAGNLLFDIEAAVLMGEHGFEEIATFDEDFRRFAFLKVVNPLQAR